MNFSSQTWVTPRCEEERREMAEYRAPTLMSWGLPWLQSLGQDSVPKLGMAALVAAVTQIQNVLWVPMAFVLAAWAVDFGVGVLRALADPDVRIDSEKAWGGVLKGLAIPLLLVLAALLEGMTQIVMGWNPDGKLVLIVAVAMLWEEATSVQRNGRHFYRSLAFRVSSLPWFNGSDKKPGGET